LKPNAIDCARLAQYFAPRIETQNRIADPGLFENLSPSLRAVQLNMMA